LVEGKLAESVASQLGERLMSNVENSIFLSRKLFEQMSELQQQVQDLSEQVKALKLNPQNPNVYFSVATAKRVHCYNCAINFELVKI